METFGQGMIAHLMPYDQVFALTQEAVTKGASCPTDEYLADYEGFDFMAVPICNVTAEDQLVALTAMNLRTREVVPRPPKLPKDLTVDQFFDIMDGNRRLATHLNPIKRKGPPVDIVFLELPKDTKFGQELILPVKIGRFYQIEGLTYMADMLEQHKDDDAEMAHVADMMRKQIQSLREEF